MDNIEEESGKIAASHFREGYNCAESVLMAMQEEWKMEKRPNIATAFGAGIGRRGSLCGVVAGGIIAINLKYGRMEAKEDKEKSYALASNYYKNFEKEFGSAICHDLIECDLTTSHGQKTFKDANLLEKKCIGFVEGAVKILTALTKEI
ncbi:MAG TPA: C-GCAxxG-C-C family protein [Candidatus Methanoperedens sp.]